MTVVGARQNQF